MKICWVISWLKDVDVWTTKTKGKSYNDHHGFRPLLKKCLFNICIWCYFETRKRMGIGMGMMLKFKMVTMRTRIIRVRMKRMRMRKLIRIRLKNEMMMRMTGTASKGNFCRAEKQSGAQPQWWEFSTYVLCFLFIHVIITTIITTTTTTITSTTTSSSPPHHHQHNFHHEACSSRKG